MTIHLPRRLLVASIVLAIAGTALPSAVAHAGVPARYREVMEVMAERRATETSAQPQHVDPDKDCLEDPVGDTTDDRADVIWWCAYLGDDEIRVAMAQAETTNPRTHPSWDGLTAAGWTFDTSGDEEAEYAALLMRVQGELMFAIVDDNGDLVCEPERQQTDTVIYQGSFGPDCLGGATRANVLALMIFDSYPPSEGEDIHLDVAPDSGPARVQRHSHSAARPTPPPRDPDPAPAPAPGGGALRRTSRLAGGDRLSTAVAISQRAFPDGAPVVYLARQDLNPDALVAGALSDGPVLLVPACGALPQVVADEIRRLGAQEVIALGGAGSVCQGLLDAAAAA